MTVDVKVAENCHPAITLIRRILQPRDASWVHERCGGDPRLVRKFRAHRRRTFYQCLSVLWCDAQSAQAVWRAGAKGSGDYSGVDWPLEMARLGLLMASTAALAEMHWLRVPMAGRSVDRLVDHLGSLKSLNPAMIPAN